MKKLIFLFAGVLCLIAGCSDEDVLLRNAEKQLKKYLDYPGSYRRVDWRITDTIFKNEMMLESLKVPLGIEEEKLESLTKNLPDLKLRLKAKREELAKCVNGKWVYPAAAQPTAAWQKPVMVTVLEEDLRSELNDILVDSTDLAAAISKITFRKDSIQNSIASLERGVRASGISQVRLEIRFRAKISNESQGTFMTKMMYLNDYNEYEILDTFYDGLRLIYRSE